MQRRVLLVAILPVPVLLVVAALLAWQVERVNERARWVEHTNLVMSDLHLAERLLIDQETGVRGFLLTADPIFLAPYELGKREFPQIVAQLRDLTSDNPGQQFKLDRLTSLYKGWLSSCISDVAAGQRSVTGLRGRKQSMDEMRLSMRQMSDVERALLLERRDSARAAEKTATGVSLVVFVLTALFLVWLIRRSARAIDSAYSEALVRERQSREAAEALAAEVTEQSQEMDRRYKSVRAERDQALRRLAELEHLLDPRS